MRSHIMVPVFLFCCLALGPRALGAPAAQAAKAGAHSASAGYAKSNGNSAQSSALQNAYLARLRGKIQNNWYLPDGKNRVEITAIVSSDGSIDSVQMTSTPKCDPAEQAAADAFSKAQPLELLPGGIAKATVVMVFTSTADPHGDSSSNVTTKMTPIQTESKAPAQTETNATPAATEKK